MKYQIIAPPSSLSPYVRFFWILESEKPYIHRNMADGCAELVFHYQGTFDELMQEGRERSALSLVHGPASRFRRYQSHTGFGIFGIYLYPFTLPMLLSLPTVELTNQVPGLESVIPGIGKTLEEQMILAQTNEERLKIITCFLEKRLTRCHQHDIGIFYAIRSIVEANGRIDVHQLANECSLSRRQFERKFKQYAGFSPKAYSQVIRFQAAVNEYDNRYKSLAQIALDCGYYDQSHFTHEFKKFSGYNPKAYFYGDPEGVEWREALD